MQNIEMRRLRFSRASRKALALHEVAEREDQAKRDLVDWLNESMETPQYDRIESLIRKIREVRALVQPLSFPEWVKKEMSTDSENAPVWEKIRAINTQLSGYKMWPRYTSFRTAVAFRSKGTGASTTSNRSPGPLIMEWWPEGEFETKAAHHIITLEGNGQLDLLLQCGVCHKWFFATVPWQKFCPGRCRGKQYSSSANGRAKRAAYMRGYRKRLKRMDEEMKKVSRRKAG
jgi:hypothetical protein